MSDFQLIVREWVKTSGFLTHELVKRFFLFYPLLCIASDCYLQVQVAFQAWFETIEQAAAAPESQEPAPPPTLPRETTMPTAGNNVTHIINPERSSMEVIPDNNAEEAIDIEEAVRGFLAEESRSEGSSAEERSE